MHSKSLDQFWLLTAPKLCDLDPNFHHEGVNIFKKHSVRKPKLSDSSWSQNPQNITFDPNLHQGVKIFKKKLHRRISQPQKFSCEKFMRFENRNFWTNFDLWQNSQNYDFWPRFSPWRSQNFQKPTSSLNFSTSKAFLVKISCNLKTKIFWPILTPDTQKLWPLTSIFTMKGSKFSKTDFTTEFLDLKSFSV